LSDLTESSHHGLRILVITNMYPPHHLGGYELSCQDVVARWRTAGHKVVVLTSDLHLDDAHQDNVEEPDVERTLRFYWKDHEILRPSWRESLAIERWNQDRLKQTIDELRPDVVSAWNMGAMSLGLLQTVGERGVPQVFVVCDDWLIHGPIIDSWSNVFRKHRLLGRVARSMVGVPTLFDPSSYEPTVCFVSDTIRKRAEEHASWTPKRSMIAYTGIDHSDFPLRDPVPRAWSWNLLCVGRVEERKGVHVAVEALARLPSEATLTIAGPADERYLPGLKARIGELDLTDRVVFAGYPRAELPDVYASADAFLFPVLWDEPFGLVPLEAMACATPVIATGMGGSKEFLFDDVNCLVSPPGDPAALSDAIGRLAADESLRDRIVRAGRTTAEKLSVDEYARVLEDWHRAAATGFAGGEPARRTPLEEMLAPLRGQP
jgi:glycogen(starch) synthase